MSNSFLYKETRYKIGDTVTIDYKLKEGDGVLVSDDFQDKRVIRQPLLSHKFIVLNKADKIANVRSFIRHDGKKFAECISKIIIP